MANTIRIKRSTGSVAPTSLANAELAFAEGSGALYIGVGTGGAGGTATTIPQIGSTALFASQSAGAVYAAPSGASGAPTFRALASGDLPSHTHTIANVTNLQTSLDAKAALAGATFTGGVTFSSTVALGASATATTPSSSDNSTAVATTAFVKAQGYTGNTGTVTSVGLSLPSIFTVSGSPVTASGTLTAALATQAAQTFLCGPVSGSPATAPTFRSIAADDLPPNGWLSTAWDAGQHIQVQSLVTDGTYLIRVYNEAGDTITAGFTDGGQLLATTANINTLAATGNGTIGGNLTVTGNLTVQGSTVTMNTETVNVEDKNLVLANVASPTTTTGDGGGITVLTGASPANDKTLQWVNATNAWTSNVDFDIASGKVYRIGGTQISAANLSNGTTGTGSVVLAASPTLTGTPLAPTAAVDTNTTQIATTAYVVGQGYLKSTTAASTYQPLDSELTSIAGLTSAADKLPYFTGSGTANLATFTAFGRSLVDDADASAARTTLGLGTIATQAANNVAITGGSIDNITIDGGTW